jgi:hypothetical protein
MYIIIYNYLFLLLLKTNFIIIFTLIELNQIQFIFVIEIHFAKFWVKVD